MRKKFKWNIKDDVLNVVSSPETININDPSVSKCLDIIDDEKNIKSIVFPLGLKALPNHMFTYSSIENVKLSKDIKNIGIKCFDSCRKLGNINLENVEVIGNSAFSSCKSLLEVTFNENLNKIGDYAFAHSGIQKVTIPSNIKSISTFAFYGCEKLESVVINEGIEEIELSSFNKCKNLKAVVLPSTLKTIGKEAFCDCVSLNKIVLPEGIETIEEKAFFSCYDIDSITIPKTVTRIGKYAFGDCHNLKELRISSWVKNVDSYIFRASYLEGLITKGDKLPNKIIIECDDREVLINGDNCQFFPNPFNCFCVLDKKDNLIKFCNNGEYREINYDISRYINNSNRLDLLFEREYLKLSYWINKNKFIPHYTIVKNMPIDDIDLFYENNNAKKWGELLKLMLKIKDYNKGTLFKLCYALGVFQESGSKSDEAIEFIKENIVSKMDEYEMHEKFDGLDTFNHKYDPMWAEFFMKHFKENPNFMKDYVTEYDDENIEIFEEQEGYSESDLIASSYNNFSKVRKIYPNKIVSTNRDADILLPEHVVNAIISREYSFVDDDNEKFALLIGRYGYTQEQFEKLQEWFNEGKNLEYSKIFISEDKKDENDITYEMLEKDNPLGAVLGNITNCCQVIGGAGESCVEYGMTKPNSRFMTFNYKKEILGQAWVWYNEETKTICLDNIEVPSRYIDKIKHNKELQESFIRCLKRMMYNFIKEMEIHGLDVDKVAVGEGYNDIKDVLKDNFYVEKDYDGLSDYKGYSDAENQFIIVKK